MKSDIQNRADVERMVFGFYEKVKQDNVIGYIFNEVAKVDWDKHMPTMYNFWDAVLLGAADYKGNPMLPHIALDKIERLLPKHFERWLAIFKQNIEELFEGERATNAKERAAQIAALMQHKIEMNRY